MIRRFILLAILILVIAVAWFELMLYRPKTKENIALEIKQGESVTGVLKKLNSTGLLPSVFSGRLYLKVYAGNRSLRFGHYQINPGSRPVDVLEQILEGRVETIEVTIIEGYDLSMVSKRFTESGIGQENDWQQIVTRVEWINDLSPTATTLEGFLFPETYHFSVGTSAETAAKHMVERFRHIWESLTSSGSPLWGSPLEVVSLASLIESETSIEMERPRIAGVFLNRLRRGMLLQCDPTVVYALKRKGLWQGQLLRIHWQLDHPYNTYRYPGLPPGPINSPGRAALEAALNPEKNSHLYFVASPSGGHTFSSTLKDHNRAVERLQRSRR